MKELFLVFLGVQTILSIAPVAKANELSRSSIGRSSARDTGVANPLRDLETRIRPANPRSGTSTGGSDGQIQLSEYCRTARLVLKRHEVQMRNFHSRGNLVGAIRAGLQGMISAIQTENSTHLPATFTLMALRTGVDMVTTLSVHLEESETKHQEMLLDLMVNYYNFVISQVIDDIDQIYFIPMFNGPHFCRDCSEQIAALEGRYINYVKQQLNFLLSQLIKNSVVDGVAAYTTVGSDRNFLEVSKIFVQAIIEGLGSSLWSERYACHIQELNLLQEYIVQFLATSGNGSIWTDEVHAVNDIITQFIQLENEVSHQCR